MASQRSVTNSAARRPCRYATSTMVASRWPWRFSPAAAIRRPTSASVRYSRARTLGIALAARRARTIRNCPNNGCRRHQREMRFCHDFSGLSTCYCPNYELSRDTAQGEKRRFYGHNCDSEPGGRTDRGARTLRWRAFSAGGARPTPPQQWPAKDDKREKRYCHAAMAGSGLDVPDFEGDFFEGVVWIGAQEQR